MIERVFTGRRKKAEEDTGWIIIEKDGKIRKARPNEIPPSIIDPRGGVSPEDGIPCKPKLDRQVRKRVKKRI
jgi:hypothetical protein